MLRDNFFYILLGLIAVILIGVTIGLQFMLLSGRSSDPPAESQSAPTAQSATQAGLEPAGGSGEQEIAMVINTPTSTPIVIAVQAESNQPSSNQVEATSTAIPPTVPPTQPPSTLAPSDQSSSSQTGGEPTAPEKAPEQSPDEETVEPTQAIAPTQIPATQAVPTPVPATATSIPVEPTSTPLLASDFVFGYIEGRTECTLFTYAMADVLESWGWSTRVVQFGSMSGIFDSALYENNSAAQPDLTFCYRDPEDREQFLSQNGTDLELVSSGYTKIDEQKYYILAHSSVPAQLRYENACILDFFKDLEIDGPSLSASNASQWLDENAGLVQSWGTCTADSN